MIPRKQIPALYLSPHRGIRRKNPIIANQVYLINSACKFKIIGLYQIHWYRRTAPHLFTRLYRNVSRASETTSEKRHASLLYMAIFINRVSSLFQTLLVLRILRCELQDAGPSAAYRDDRRRFPLLREFHGLRSRNEHVPEPRWRRRPRIHLNDSRQHLMFVFFEEYTVRNVNSR